MQSLIAFSVSTSVHSAACLALALVFISGQGNWGDRFQVSVAQSDGTDGESELDFSAETSIDPLDEPETFVQFTSVSTAVDLDLEPVGMVLSNVGSSGDVASEIARVARSGIKEAAASNPGSPSKATFFGAEAHGNRFVFVIDSSGSMRGRRWEALCKELIRAIKSLSPDQDFFVVSFDATEHPMFGLAPPRGKFLKAVPKNIAKMQNWLLSIEHGRNTFPASAVGLAMKLEPDGIFLLSDGEIEDSTIADLQIWNRKQDEEGNWKAMVPIHTVLLHSERGFAALETIARENGGSFTPVRAR